MEQVMVEKKDSKSSKKVYPVKNIITHLGTHLDEIVAIMKLKMYGEELFPGIGEAEVLFWEYANKTPDGRSADQYLKEDGMLFVGICGSIFDEHAIPGSEGHEGECSTTLIAKYLGTQDDPVWQKILKYVHREDTRARNDPFSIGPMVKEMHEANPDDPALVFSCTIEFMKAKYLKHKRFFEPKKEFDARAKTEEIPGQNGKKIRLVTIKSDHTEMSRYARSEYGCRASIVIQQTSSGNVQIFTAEKARINLDDLARMIRAKEQMIKLGKVITTGKRIIDPGDPGGKKKKYLSKREVLASDGQIDGAEMWHFLKAAPMLLNGSTNITSDPTQIPLGAIVDYAKLALDTSKFDSKRSSDCESGECTSSPDSPCRLFPFSLDRCYDLRESKK